MPGGHQDATPGLDLEVLAGWMDERALESGPIINVSELTGGTQNLMVRFKRGSREFVLRRPPIHKRDSSDETMRREARVLLALKDSGVPHPALIASEADESVLGAAFYLMEPIDGFNPAQGLPELHAGSPEIRREMGFALADAAAAIGGVDYVAAGLGEFGRPVGYLERQVGRWRAQLDTYAKVSTAWMPDIPGLDEAGQWLEANIPTTFQPGLIHGDYHLGNVMYSSTGPALAAVIDWELATIGDPMIDLGLIVAFWPTERHPGAIPVRPWEGFPSIEEMTKRYAQQSGRDTSAIDWYGVLACYKTGIILEGTYARALAGKAPREQGERLHGLTLRLFERASILIAAA